MEIITLLVIGLIAGLIAGLMGVGGGIIFTPVLYFLFSDAGVESAVQWSVASGLFCTLVAASSSAVQQLLKKNIFLKESVMLGLMGVVGVYLGRLVLTSSYYNREEFAILFSLILFYASFMMFKRGRDKTRESEREFSDMGIKETFVTGGIGGFLASLAGVGGGGVMVPIMNLIFKQPFIKSVSLSQMGMVILISSGVIQLALIDVPEPGISAYTLGYVDFGAALPLSIGGLFGGFGGAYLNHIINRKVLQWGFALLAVVMATRLLMSVF